MNYMIKMGGGSILPSEYQEVEYIQGSGTQYINTGISLTSEDTVKCKFVVLETPTSGKEAIYGAMENIGGNNKFFVLLMRSPNTARVGTGSNQATSTNLQLNIVYDTTLSNGTYIENGTTYTFTAAASFSLTNTCYVMSRNQTSYTPIVAKLYSFEIVGKFNGIPCYRKADGEIGLYDIVNNVFYTNAGTGTFLKGNNVVAYQSIPIGVFSGGKETSKIPSEYQEVEWIKGNIDTGEELEPKNVSETYEIVQYMEGYNNGYFFSNDKDNLYCRLGLRLLNDVYKMWFYFGGNNNTSANYAPLENKKIKIQLTKNAVANNGTMAANCQYYDENSTLLGTSGTYAPKANVDNWYTKFADGLPKLIIGNGYKLYSFKKVNGKELVPCYRKNDNVIGMYDIVNNMFIEATGTTEKGNNISTKINITYNALKTYNN